MSEPSLEELAELFTPKRSYERPVTFLRPDQKDALLKILPAPRSAAQKLIAGIDGLCWFYAYLDAQPSPDEHREALRKIANRLYDIEDELARLCREIPLKRQYRFPDCQPAVAAEVTDANRAFVKHVWMARLAVGRVAHEIRAELSPCWPPDGRQITYVPPLAPKSRKAGRKAVEQHLFTELVSEVARAYERAFGSRPVSTKHTSPFQALVRELAKIVGYPARNDPSKVIRAALKLAFPKTTK